MTLPVPLIEAAKVDGANALQLFWNITIPSIRTTLELLVVLASIFSFKQFTFIFLMTGGGPSGATEEAEGLLDGLGWSMLHFELYRGTASGPLTVVGNPPYQRRRDLVNPTKFVEKLLRTSF